MSRIEDKIIEQLNKAKNKLSKRKMEQLSESVISYIDELNRPEKKLDKFWVTYKNVNSPSDGREYYVFEAKWMPNHYLIAGAGGGTLRKTHCIRK